MSVQDNKGKAWIVSICFALVLATIIPSPWVFWVSIITLSFFVAWIIWSERFEKVEFFRRLGRIIELPFKTGMASEDKDDLAALTNLFRRAISEVHATGGHDRERLDAAETVSKTISDWLRRKAGKLAASEFEAAPPSTSVRQGQAHATAGAVQRLEGQLEALRGMLSRIN